MVKTILRSSARKIFNAPLNYGMKEFPADDLKNSAIVFAPHPDDETLGCGGTIIKKKRAGADIKIAFMTDGAYSHVQLMAASQLKTIRRREALSACKCLGIDEEDIIFFEFEDGKFINNYHHAIDSVVDVLSAVQPQEVFIPYHEDKDPNLDHIATHKAVAAAIQAMELKIIINEYPVWFWWKWPWMNLPIRRNRKISTVFMENLKIGRRLLCDFNHFVFVGSILGQKKTALSYHQSQTRRLVPDTRWMTLGDLSGGEFLDIFFQDREIYCRHELV
jgi:LmbE family N-acetylglucosaminyl deacetylase